MKENNQLDIYLPIFMVVLSAVIAMLSAYFTTKFQIWNDKSKKENEKWIEYKDERYKTIISLMLWALEFDKATPKYRKYNRADINTISDLVDELDTELKNMILYAGDNVIKAMAEFMKVQSEENFCNTTLEMRKDLYGIKTQLDSSDIRKYINAMEA